MRILKLIWILLFLVGICMLFSGATLAAVSKEEAKQLGTTLTGFGAEKAGNVDGSIPEYTGGLPYRSAGPDRYEDPFKGEKPLYNIDAKNVQQYESQLTVGTRALIERFPTYRIDVYPTHRTVRYPEWVLENTIKNATTAKLTGKIEGDKIAGEDEEGLPFPGIPFPIPKTGCEVMWNHALHNEPPITHMANSGWLVDAAGRPSLIGDVNQYYVRPWYEKSGKLRRKTRDAVCGFSVLMNTPPTSAGTYFLGFYLPDLSVQRVWFYSPGNRRVRKAPEFSYDVPIAAYGGVLFWDEVFGFVGRMDRFDFNLIGKREIIIPYNSFMITNQATVEETIGSNHVNPETIRWEKHRVWVVDSTRKAEARHAYKRRVFYIDEDSWAIIATESYDGADNLWRIAFFYNFPAYDVGGINTNIWNFYDVVKGNYFLINIGRNERGNFVRSYTESEDLAIPVTPQAVAAGGVR